MREHGMHRHWSRSCQGARRVCVLRALSAVFSARFVHSIRGKSLLFVTPRAL